MSEPDPIDALRDQQARLLEALSRAPMVDITGVVGASGSTGSKLGSEALWTIGFTFIAWRVGTGSIDTQALTVRRQVDAETLTHYRNRVQADTVVRVRARLAPQNPSGSPQALLEALVGPINDDAELNRVLAQAQQPVTLNDAQFGVFSFDRRLESFEAKTQWGRAQIALTLVAAEPAEIERALTNARELWRSQSDWQARIERYAVERLLSLKNETWLGEDEKPFSAKAFVARMRLESIVVYPDGSFEFWHDDGELFWGHAISVSGNLTDGPTDADIPG